MTVRKEEVEELTENDLNKVINITLEETDTILMFEQKGVAVSEEGEDAQITEKRNQAYEELCKTKEGNDRFSDRGMQTFNNALKNKEIQAEKVGLTDAGINVTSWDMYATYTSIAAPPSDETAQATPGSRAVSIIESSQHKTKQGSEEESLTTSRITESRASVLTMSVMGEVEPETPAQTERPVTMEGSESGVNPQWEAICNGESIKRHLVIIERVVTENIYQPKQATYRGMQILVGKLQKHKNI
uniref:WD repeat-containing protein 78 n=1 Tax=Phallusia mammillata TaxID=59560 RepID=A0A6F9DXG2_9ASCI|nr:WD repeat-containing protein 78 [Phallusia mammillata]